MWLYGQEAGFELVRPIDTLPYFPYIFLRPKAPSSASYDMPADYQSCNGKNGRLPYSARVSRGRVAPQKQLQSPIEPHSETQKKQKQSGVKR